MLRAVSISHLEAAPNVRIRPKMDMHHMRYFEPITQRVSRTKRPYMEAIMSETTVMRSSIIAFGGAAALAALLAVGGAASAQTVNKCQAVKKKCVIKKMKGLLKCHVTAEARGLAVDPACLQKHEDKFDGRSEPATSCFAKVEARSGCLTTGDTAVLESKIDAFVDDVVHELDPSHPQPVLNKCSSGKKKCVFKKTAGLLGCHAKAGLKGVLDPACLQKHKDKVDGGSEPAAGCFARLEAESGCLTTGDAVVLEAKIDAFVDDVVCELDPSGGTCPASCDVSPFPACGGPCPGDGVCTIGYGICRCVSPTSPCGETSPVCNGTCAAGEQCAAVGPGPLPGCVCLPDGATPCGSPGAPVCGGACPSGDVCRPFYMLPSLGGALGCGCAPPGECGQGGLDCRNGFACALIPPLNYICAPIGCGDSPAYPTCSGTCVAGAACQPIRLADYSFTQCVCAIPAPCDASCGGYTCAAGEVCRVQVGPPETCGCGAP